MTVAETSCWTCGAEIAPQVWRLAPREPEPNGHLRVCVDCHDTIDFLGGDRPLRIANMIRFAAGIPTVAPLHSGHAIAADEPRANGREGQS